MIPKINKYSSLIIRIIDILIVIVCYIASMYFLDNNIDIHSKMLIRQLIISVVLFEAFLTLFRLYQNILRYEVGNDYTKYALCALMYMRITGMTIRRILLICMMKMNVAGNCHQRMTSPTVIRSVESMLPR